MTNYGFDPEDTHESMHIRRRQRRYNGHKLAVAVGLNRKLRAINSSGALKHKAIK